MREKESGWVHGSESSGSYSQPSTMVWWWGMSGFLMLWDSHVLELGRVVFDWNIDIFTIYDPKWWQIRFPFFNPMVTYIRSYLLH